MFNLEFLLSQNERLNYPVQSRIHPLKTYNKSYVKRDDELGFGISGSKVRKYLYLIPWLKSKKPDEVLLIGSSHSNNIVGLLQALRENSFKTILFLCGPPPKEIQGNFLWISLLADPNAIRWIPKEDWSKVEEMATQYQLEKLREGIQVEIIPEGASHEKSFLGALTLPLDILKNEKDTGIAFDHIFIDSATAVTASALICGFALMQRETKIHVLQLYGDQKEFDKHLSHWSQSFSQMMHLKTKLNLKFDLFFPESARSFGSVNGEILQQLMEIARNEGFLTDPVYSGKLFIEAKKRIVKESLNGNILIIHSGGALSLMGFQEMIAKKINSLSNTQVF